MKGEYQPSPRNVFIDVYVNAIDKCVESKFMSYLV
jgi:hypothetical protein